jgi:hypothetical protein
MSPPPCYLCIIKPTARSILRTAASGKTAGINRGCAPDSRHHRTIGLSEDMACQQDTDSRVRDDAFPQLKQLGPSLALAVCILLRGSAIADRSGRATRNYTRSRQIADHPLTAVSHRSPVRASIQQRWRADNTEHNRKRYRSPSGQPLLRACPARSDWEPNVEPNPIHWRCCTARSARKQGNAGDPLCGNYGQSRSAPAATLEHGPPAMRYT